MREADGGAHRRGFYSASSLHARRPSFPPGSPAVTSPSCVRFRGSLSSRLLLIIRSPTCSCLSRGGSEPPRPPAPPSSGGVTRPGPAGGVALGILRSLPQPPHRFRTVVGCTLPLHARRADASAVSRSLSYLGASLRPPRHPSLPVLYRRQRAGSIRTLGSCFPARLGLKENEEMLLRNCDLVTF